MRSWLFRLLCIIGVWVIMFSLDGNFHLLHLLPLQLSNFPKEFYFVFAWRFPLIVCLKCALQVCLYIHVESLWFNLGIWWVINTWNCPCRWQVMKISGKLMEFCSSSLLLKLGLLDQCFSSEFIKLLSHLFILRLDVLEIAFPGIEIMLVLSTVESSVIFLYYLSLFIKEFALFVFHFILLLIHKLATANITSPDALDFLCSLLFILILPFNSKHSPVFLDHKSSCIFLVPVFLSLIDHGVVGVHKIPVTFLTLFEVHCH